MLIQTVPFQDLFDGLVSGEQHVSMSSLLRLSSHFAGQCVVQLNPMEVQVDALGRDASSVATTWGFMVKLPPNFKGYNIFIKQPTAVCQKMGPNNM
jgi:hypothetical protein